MLKMASSMRMVGMRAGVAAAAASASLSSRSLLRAGLATSASSGPSKRTALYAFHQKHGGKLVPFAGWDMPVQYADQGMVASHHHTRKSASLFDVSHMLQFKLHGKDRIKFIESLTVADVAALANGAATLSVFTNEKGGIIDDTVISKYADHLYIVSNAGCADKDLAHLHHHLAAFKSKGGDVALEVLSGQSLLALQGPKAAEVLSKLVKADLAKLGFMSGTPTTVQTGSGAVNVLVTRCGYTGEDGFEISVPHSHAVALAEALLHGGTVKLAGLGPRDSLRLEAGLCLYGNDLNEDITPVEGSLVWTIGARRRLEGGFVGAKPILDQLNNKSEKIKRVGLLVDGAPARAGYAIHNAQGAAIGNITSGCPSPTLQKNVAMGYVPKEFAKIGTPVKVSVRGDLVDATIAKMPFVPHTYYRLA